MNTRTTHINLDESLIFEKSAQGRIGFDLPSSEDFPEIKLDEVVGEDNIREEISDFPEVSEVDVVRHFTRLSNWNYHIAGGPYPLGSCTMKYNPKVNEYIANLQGLSTTHPLTPENFVQGNLEALYLLSENLKEITGMDAVSLQPPAGASGELTGVLILRSFLEDKGEHRRKILIPDSAHGTNPASAAIAGYSVKTLISDEHGCLNLNALKKEMDDDVAALILTNPNTLGIFETNIEKISQVVHDRGGLVYMDGANLNALMGISRPGDFGVDLLHMNLHKTFSTPHGGGGPGSGPVAVKDFLEPYLPTPKIKKLLSKKYVFDYDCPKAIGKIKAFHGNFGTLIRALAYILANGSDGLKRASCTAILNANYIRHHLKDTYNLPYQRPVLHEVVFSSKNQAKNGVSVMDIAKRLMDYGFHPPTVAFPLIVQGALMIEPTETESRQELDLFIKAMKAISIEAQNDPDLLMDAPHLTRIKRLDEVRAARNPILRWKGTKNRVK